MKIKKTHIGTYGIIIENNKIVLIKKARGGYLGKLDLPGGGIEHKETLDEALKREIMEETGLEITNYSLFDITSTNIEWEMEHDKIEDLHHIGILYNVNAKLQKLKTTKDGLDSNGADWYIINNLKKEDLTPFAIYSLEKLGYKIS